MSAPKILNIDEFATVKRVLRFKGTDYEVKELSVQAFIDNLKAAEDLEAQGGAKEKQPEAVSAQVELAIKNILESIPEFPETDLRSLQLPAMSAILRFIRGDMDEEVLKSPDADKKKD